MIIAIRVVVFGLSLGVLVAGCGPAPRAEYRRDSAAAEPAHATEASVDREARAGSSAQDDSVLGYRAAPASRYDITLDEIREHVQNNTAVFIDARGPRDFDLGHLRGAFNMPAGQKSTYMAEFSKSVAPSEFIIIYCNGPHCDSSDMLYEYLASHGYANMRVFKPGWQTLAKERDLR